MTSGTKDNPSPGDVTIAISLQVASTETGSRDARRGTVVIYLAQGIFCLTAAARAELVTSLFPL